MSIGTLTYSFKTQGIKSSPLRLKHLKILVENLLYLMNLRFDSLYVFLLLTFLINKKIQNQGNEQKKYTSYKKDAADRAFHED